MKCRTTYPDPIRWDACAAYTRLHATQGNPRSSQKGDCQKSCLHTVSKQKKPQRQQCARPPSIRNQVPAPPWSSCALCLWCGSGVVYELLQTLNWFVACVQHPTSSLWNKMPWVNPGSSGHLMGSFIVWDPLYNK